MYKVFAYLCLYLCISNYVIFIVLDIYTHILRCISILLFVIILLTLRFTCVYICIFQNYIFYVLAYYTEKPVLLQGESVRYRYRDDVLVNMASKTIRCTLRRRSRTARFAILRRQRCRTAVGT